MKLKLGTAGAIALALGMAGTAMATTTVVVHEGDTVANKTTECTPTDFASSNWCEWNRDTGALDFASDYGAPAGFGTGSLTLDTPASNDKANLKTDLHTGTALGAIDAIAYDAYRSSASTASAVQTAGLNVEIDINGGTLNSGEYTTLVYEPVYNNGSTAIPVDVWQHYDAIDGGDAVWWSTRTVGTMCGGATASCDRSWSEILAEFPQATVLAVSINQGGGNPGLYTGVDGLTFDETTYDFEPFVPTKDDCKDGGWATNFPAGQYKNQGACVSAFARAD
jgi:hypothetical protein